MEMARHWFENDDIHINILSRLDAKTLHYLKYVSKEWYDLISDRSFIHSQLKRKEPFAGFFFQEKFEWSDNNNVESITYIPSQTESFKAFHAVLSFLPENIIILSSNNGLICGRSCFPTSQPMIYICNPLNKQWKSLPWPGFSRNNSLALVFDPLKNFLDGSTEFKLVAVSQVEIEEEEEYNFLFDIYSSKTGSWKRSKECCLCDQKIIKNKGVCMEGISYWLTEEYQILMFDPENELSWLIMAPIPATQFGSIAEMCLGESEEKLYYVIISEGGIQIWVLKDRFGSHWSLEYHILLQNFEKENPGMLYNMEDKVMSRVSKDTLAWLDPLAFKDGILFLKVDGYVNFYRFETKEMKRLCDTTVLGPTSMFSPIVVPYVMSLVPLG